MYLVLHLTLSLLASSKAERKTRSGVQLSSKNTRDEFRKGGRTRKQRGKEEKRIPLEKDNVGSASFDSFCCCFDGCFGCLSGLTLGGYLRYEMKWWGCTLLRRR